ncbi:MAG: hypothetical protein K9K79_05640 [Desulfohalobiaceae bacterium]|nr:hypothetical protein [Desulfohalobiaceae bacterium]
MKKIDLIFLTLIVILTLAYGCWAISATRDYRDLILDQKKEAAQAEQDLGLARTRLLKLKKALGDLQEDMKQLTSYLSPDQRRGALFQEMDSLIREAGLTLVNLQPGQTGNVDLYRKKNMQIICKGRILPILELIRNLESLEAPLVLDKVRIIPLESEKQYRLLINGGLIHLSEEAD